MVKERQGPGSGPCTNRSGLKPDRQGMRHSSSDGVLVVQETSQTESRGLCDFAWGRPAGGTVFSSSSPTPTVGLELDQNAPEAPFICGTGIEISLPGGIEVRGLTSIEQVVALYLGCRV